MTTHAVTLNVPSPLYDRLKQRAERANRPVEAEFLDLLTAAVSTTEGLPADLGAALTALEILDDASLWRAARSSMPPEAAAELEGLHDKQQQEGLTGAETRRLAGLVHQYERAMLIRAEAAAILRRRGHDVSRLLAPA